MYKWRITNVSTGEIWEKDKEFKAPMAAFQSIRMFVTKGLTDMWIDAGDQLMFEIVDTNDEVIVKGSKMDAAYIPSLGWKQANVLASHTKVRGYLPGA